MFLTLAFRPSVNVAATIFFGVVLLTKIWRCTNFLIIYLFQKYANCLAISFFDKKNRFLLPLCKTFAQFEAKIWFWKFEACCLKREKGFEILSSILIKSYAFSDCKFGRAAVWLHSEYWELKNGSFLYSMMVLKNHF